MHQILVSSKDTAVRFPDSLNGRHLVYFLIIYLLAWTLLIGLIPSSIVLDSIEQVVWSQTWQWGYYKHPPFPSILISGLNHLLGGPSMWLTIFAAQGCNVIALLYVWLLAKKLLPNKLAVVAVLLTSLIGYHNYSPSSFDHNTVSLPFSAAIIYYFYSAIRRPERILVWAILGLVAGLGMLTKYSALLVIASCFVCIIWQGLWSNILVLRGILIGLSVFLLVVFPHVYWLYNHQWLPFTYFCTELSIQHERIDILSRFFIGQALPLLPMVFAVILLLKFGASNPDIKNKQKTSKLDNDWKFLLAALFTPLVLALMPPLVNGYFISRNWVSAFFLPTGIVLVKYLFCKYDEERLLQSAYRIALPLQAVILLSFLVIKVFYPTLTGHPVRTTFPSQLFAEKAVGIWQEYQSQPLAIVVADTWLGGHVLLHARPEPMLLIDNNFVISTWVTPDDLKDCGALVLTDELQKSLPVYADLFGQAQVAGDLALPWGNSEQRFAWAVVPPAPDAKPCRFDRHAELS